MKKYNKIIIMITLFFLCGISFSCEKKEALVLEQEGILSEQEEKAEIEEKKSGNENQEAKETIFIHICGAVKNPGVYEVPEGTRIFEAINLAGGMTKEAASDYLNQAEQTVDGQKLIVPTQEEVEDMPVGLQTEEESGLVNINTAKKEQLMEIPGIGESKAESIIAYREEKGGFTSIEDIQNIAGIKSGVYEKIKSHICVR